MTYSSAPTGVEDLAHGMAAHGLSPGQAVTVQWVRWIGQNADEITTSHRTTLPGHHVVDRAGEARLRLSRPAETLEFTRDGALFELAAEAQRIRLAHLSNPRLAAHLR